MDESRRLATGPPDLKRAQRYSKKGPISIGNARSSSGQVQRGVAVVAVPSQALEFIGVVDFDQHGHAERKRARLQLGHPRVVQARGDEEHSVGADRVDDGGVINTPWFPDAARSMATFPALTGDIPTRDWVLWPMVDRVGDPPPSHPRASRRHPGVSRLTRGLLPWTSLYEGGAQ